jgi:GNAT superfamily N-acetyltransferase
MSISFTQLEGPRLLRREELIASMHLSQLCFGGPEINNKEEILAHYVSPRRGGTYVLLHQEEPVSQIAIFHDQLKMYDETIRVGSIGGVCTHPDYRKRGLATQLMEHRSKSTSSDLVVRRATEADALLCSRLYQTEPVHFVRHKSDFARALRNPRSNTYVHADPWIIERSGQVAAYLFLGFLWGLPDGLNSGIRHVGEYAGSRSALVDALDLLAARSNLKDLSWPVAWQDVELTQLLQDRGFVGNMTHLEGATHRIINFPGLMKRLRPMLQARLDAKLLNSLRFEQCGPLLGGIGEDRYTIIHGSDRLELDGAAMTRLVMGNSAPQTESVHAPGLLAEAISQIFPLPSFLPGLNYH